MPSGKPASHVLPLEIVERRIYVIRGHKVMLSHHLAELYGVEPRMLVQAVKRNSDRFPEDFMFQLTAEEFANLRSQIVIKLGRLPDGAICFHRARRRHAV
jgi:hypothetical protein